MTHKRYIDIRITVELETEDFGDGDTYTFIEKATAKIKKVNDVPDDALYSLYESFGQSDRWQLWLQDEIPSAIEEYTREAGEV